MRAELERQLGKPFPKVRPSFLKDPALGQRWPLELDAYCSELQLAAEFHGVQHYQWPNPFHNTRAQFQAQQRRDSLKVTLCERQRVRLIIVPHTVTKEDIADYLVIKLKELQLYPAGETDSQPSAESDDAASDCACSIARLPALAASGAPSREATNPSTAVDESVAEVESAITLLADL